MTTSLREPETNAEAQNPTCGGFRCPLSGKNATHASWAATPLQDRLAVLRAARHHMAAQPEAFAAAISPQLARTQADTLVSELLPLLDACKFLEKNAERLLAPRRLGRAGRPFWLSGISAEVHREPLGHILVIGPANFPLFLPGTQVLQALAAGNTVTWKPGSGGGQVAAMMAAALYAAGFPPHALAVTDDTVEAAQAALAQGADKVVFTGAAGTATDILTKLAATATPAVVELSGADAIVVMPSADLDLVARAVAYGLRLNGGAVCMSPRRLFATPETLAALRPQLLQALGEVPPVPLSHRTSDQLRTLVESAVAEGARTLGVFAPEAQSPLLIDHATPHMEITRSDIFAPVLSLLEVPTLLHLQQAYAACPYALTASIFCARADEKKARMLASTLRAGTVLINDIIAPTADPRVPFSGRGASGYGATRGAEGLLEMTAVKTLLVRRGGQARHLKPTTNADVPVFSALIRSAHAGTWRERLRGLRELLSSRNS